MTPRGALIALGVLAAFLALFVPLALRVRSGEGFAVDAARMRRVYAALALYESTHDGLPAPNLAFVQRDVDPMDLAAMNDRRIASGDFPLDPALPNSPLRSATRVSWSYRWHWPEAGDPQAVRLDGRRGLLAGWWNGPIQRVNVDGSLIEAPHQGLTFTELFGK